MHNTSLFSFLISDRAACASVLDILSWLRGAELGMSAAVARKQKIFVTGEKQFIIQEQFLLSVQYYVGNSSQPRGVV